MAEAEPECNARASLCPIRAALAAWLDRKPARHTTFKQHLEDAKTEARPESRFSNFDEAVEQADGLIVCAYWDAALAKKTTREAREARERRYRREIDDARRSLVEQKEMWLGLVKDSEQQCRDLELEVAAVAREEAALSSQLDDVRRNDDGAVEVLTGELVAMKLRAAELSNECDMLDHHAQLVRRQVPR